jgi:hypothetical protein
MLTHGQHWRARNLAGRPITKPPYANPNLRLAMPGLAKFQVFLQGRMANIDFPSFATASLRLPLNGDSLITV